MRPPSVVDDRTRSRRMPRGAQVGARVALRVAARVRLAPLAALGVQPLQPHEHVALPREPQRPLAGPVRYGQRARPTDARDLRRGLVGVGPDPCARRGLLYAAASLSRRRLRGRHSGGRGRRARVDADAARAR